MSVTCQDLLTLNILNVSNWLPGKTVWIVLSPGPT